MTPPGRTAAPGSGLELELRHRFPGGRALEIGFAAPLPGIIGLWGRSGAGKSSVVAALSGTFRPDHCRISLDGAVLADERSWKRPERRRVGTVFQDGRLFPHLDVRDNLLYGARRARRMADGTGTANALGFDAVVALLGIEALLERRIRGLSGGEAQRVAIGRALLSRPRILALDEPLAALDPARKREILPFLRRLRGIGMPMLYVTHSREEAAALCDRIVVLADGRVVEQGEAAAVLSGPTLGGRPDAAALLEGVVVAVGGGVVRVSAGGWEVVATAPAGGIAVGTRGTRLSVPARAVVLLDGTGEGIAASARNLLPARVLSVTAEHDITGAGTAPGAAGAGTTPGAAGAQAALGAAGAATIRLGPDGTGTGVLLARVTAESVHRLRIAPGRRLLAMVKAEAVSVAGEEDAD